MNIILNCRQERFRENIAFLSRIVVRKDTSRLVPVRRFSSPSRSIHFGDASEPNRRGNASHFRLDHVTQNALATQQNEAKGLGKSSTTVVDRVEGPGDLTQVRLSSHFRC